MGTLIVVENDKVEGTDTHNVSGNYTDPNTSAPAPGMWTGKFDYKGKMTDALSDFVTVGGKPMALVTSKSSLNPGETSPAGKHNGANANSYTPIPPAVGNPLPAPPASIIDPVGEGKPSAGTGSSFVTVGGTAVLLDGDSIDTCDGLGAPKNSTVTSENQDFVGCSA